LFYKKNNFANLFKKIMAEQKEELMLDVQEAYSKTEKYIEENKKSLGIIIGSIALVIVGYFAWDNLYLKPKEQKAMAAMFKAQQFFDNDSLDKAINGVKGDETNLGFKRIAEEFGMTESANLAHYYLGISYLKKGSFNEAIQELEKFDSDDQMLEPVAIGAMGDANLELNKTGDAISLYLKAAKLANNKFLSPIYLMKAAGVYEDEKNYENALKIYQQIKTDYNNSTEGRDIEKYISRANTSMAK
jgi:tetratricopeptide (TPR) repeat protein